jgi:hypothetical protein
MVFESESDLTERLLETDEDPYRILYVAIAEDNEKKRI